MFNLDQSGLPDMDLSHIRVLTPSILPGEPNGKLPFPVPGPLRLPPPPGNVELKQRLGNWKWKPKWHLWKWKPLGSGPDVPTPSVPPRPNPTASLS